MVPLSIFPAIPAGHSSKNAQPVLEAGGLTLRSWFPEDAPAVLRAFTNPAIQHWHRRIKALAWIDQCHDRRHAEKAVSWAITRAAEVVGRLSLSTINLFEGVAQITYWILPVARSQGVAQGSGTGRAWWAGRLVIA
ncbi:GNAT family N-acetyltransferase [Sphaerimonospora sp. CA-214678]|uniref:GNAT family N-acetyltransferase n=1 Tax=Sphaerimonospora sp. CA-214678 TaxID=3240029 RepID=UPI003D8FF4D5